MMIRFEHEFKIGQDIYHKTPESDRGLILDISFSVLNNRVKYLVTFGRSAEDEIWCKEHELSESKLF